MEEAKKKILVAIAASASRDVESDAYAYNLRLLTEAYETLVRAEATEADTARVKASGQRPDQNRA